jgi:hypothetical protein
MVSVTVLFITMNEGFIRNFAPKIGALVNK